MLQLGLLNWRLWILSLCWFLVEASIYGILFWAPLLLDAIFVSSPSGHYMAPDVALQPDRSWFSLLIMFL